jgi:hypothetical protein
VPTLFIRFDKIIKLYMHRASEIFWNNFQDSTLPGILSHSKPAKTTWWGVLCQHGGEPYGGVLYATPIHFVRKFLFGVQCINYLFQTSRIKLVNQLTWYMLQSRLTHSLILVPWGALRFYQDVLIWHLGKHWPRPMVHVFVTRMLRASRLVDKGSLAWQSLYATCTFIWLSCAL